VLTTQAARDGATFGSAAALGFRGTLPKYVCPTGPTTYLYLDNSAVAATCDARDIGVGFSYTGTLARLRFPARSAAVYVAGTAVTPAGIPVEIDGFDADGKLVTRNAVLVSAAYLEEPAGQRRLTLAPGLYSHAIAFVALYVNNPISSFGLDSPPPLLSFASLSWEEKHR
jgi:hypothetical protein